MKKILFWGPEGEGDPLKHRRRVPGDERQALVKILVGGQVVAQRRGKLSCPLCKAALGLADVGSHGFVWPEKAEHYLLQHDIWTPGCQELFQAACKDFAA